MHAIREYRPADFPALYALDQACFPPGIAYSRNELRYVIQRRSALTLLAESCNGTASEGAGPMLAGFAVADKAVQHAELLGHLITIDVKPEVQHRGVGTRLLQALEQRLAADGVQRMRLEVAEDNAAAHSFYRKSGYASIGRIEKYYLGSTDALLMEKLLRGPEASG